MVRGNEVFVPLEGVVDFEAEIARVGKQLGKLAEQVAVIEKKLSNQGFVSKAPAEVVDKERAKLSALAEEKDKLSALEARLRSVVG